ncbi:hypothetical protein [Streptomyces rimosus]|uniref:hypothetical protein n=1 Tax=Streptomyces rimosus TaxID=1927 RepID=UPI000AEFDD1D|nr:hypothetical protein [Streptomyces rimosus]
MTSTGTKPPPTGGCPVVYAARESIPAGALDRLDADEAAGGEEFNQWCRSCEN